MKKILLSVLTIGLVASVAFGATQAYFTAVETSDANIFNVGTLGVEIKQDGYGYGTGSYVIEENWKPGDTSEVRFDVVNTKDFPVHLAGFASGTWDDGGLNPEMVKVTKVEAWHSSWGYWYTIDEDIDGLFGEYYFIDVDDLRVLNPNETAYFRLTLKFDENADNDYQEQTFTGIVTVAAKQLEAPAFNWEAE